MPEQSLALNGLYNSDDLKDGHKRNKRPCEQPTIAISICLALLALDHNRVEC